MLHGFRLNGDDINFVWTSMIRRYVRICNSNRTFPHRYAEKNNSESLCWLEFCFNEKHGQKPLKCSPYPFEFLSMQYNRYSLQFQHSCAGLPMFLSERRKKFLIYSLFWIEKVLSKKKPNHIFWIDKSQQAYGYSIQRSDTSNKSVFWGTATQRN